jgi:hypothetical protein
MSKSCLIFIALSLATGCAAIRESNERFYYQAAKETLQELATDQNNGLRGIDESCRYDFEVGIPRFEAGQSATYSKANWRIKYPSDRPEAIVHEAAHHFFRNGENGMPQTYLCLEQTAAVLLSELVFQKMETENLRFQIATKRRK